MESEKYLEGQSMQRPPLFESDGFIYWKNRFETYVKSKDLDLWHVITYGDFPPIQNNPETKKDEIVPFDKQNDDLKKKLAKNNKAKMIMAPKRRSTTTTTTTTPITDAQLKALIAQGVVDALAERVDALAERDADRSRNGDDSHDSGTGVKGKRLLLESVPTVTSSNVNP
ncbi:hypothetical protein Tco_1338270 [Tanacetum coccineum]